MDKTLLFKKSILHLYQSNVFFTKTTRFVFLTPFKLFNLLVKLVVLYGVEARVSENCDMQRPYLKDSSLDLRAIWYSLTDITHIQFDRVEIITTKCAHLHILWKLCAKYKKQSSKRFPRLRPETANWAHGCANDDHFEFMQIRIKSVNSTCVLVMKLPL